MDLSLLHINEMNYSKDIRTKECFSTYLVFVSWEWGSLCWLNQERLILNQIEELEGSSLKAVKQEVILR